MNIRPVSAETSAWVLQQFHAVQDLPLPDLSEKAVDWALHTRSAPIPAPQYKAMSRKALEILSEVALDHGLTQSVILSHTQFHRPTRARYEFWARCRNEIEIGGKPVSFAWIGSHSGFDSSSVWRGVEIHNGAERAYK